MVPITSYPKDVTDVTGLTSDPLHSQDLTCNTTHNGFTRSTDSGVTGTTIINTAIDASEQELRTRIAMGSRRSGGKLANAQSMTNTQAVAQHVLNVIQHIPNRNLNAVRNSLSFLNGTKRYGKDLVEDAISLAQRFINPGFGMREMSKHLIPLLAAIANGSRDPAMLPRIMKTQYRNAFFNIDTLSALCEAAVSFKQAGGDLSKINEAAVPALCHELMHHMDPRFQRGWWVMMNEPATYAEPRVDAPSTLPNTTAATQTAPGASQNSVTSAAMQTDASMQVWTQTGTKRKAMDALDADADHRPQVTGFQTASGGKLSASAGNRTDGVSDQTQQAPHSQRLPVYPIFATDLSASPVLDPVQTLTHDRTHFDTHAEDPDAFWPPLQTRPVQTSTPSAWQARYPAGFVPAYQQSQASVNAGHAPCSQSTISATHPPASAFPRYAATDGRNPPAWGPTAQHPAMPSHLQGTQDTLAFRPHSWAGADGSTTATTYATTSTTAPWEGQDLMQSSLSPSWSKSSWWDSTSQRSSSHAPQGPNWGPLFEDDPSPELTTRYPLNGQPPSSYPAQTAMIRVGAPNSEFVLQGTCDPYVDPTALRSDPYAQIPPLPPYSVDTDIQGWP